MKQGRATHSGAGSTKIEPLSHAVNPAGVARLGTMQGDHATDVGKINVQHVPVYRGRGLEAPMVGTTIHHCGSQGKHK